MTSYRRIAVTAVVTLLCGAVAYFTWGFYFDSNDDPIYVLLLNGVLTGTVESDFLFWHVLTGRLIAALFEAFPSIPWYSLYLYICLWISVIQFLSVCSTWFQSARWYILWTASVFFFVLLDNTTNLNYTRVAILLSCSSVISFLHRLRESSSTGLQLGNGLWALFGFTVAILMRWESAILGGGIALAMVGFLVHDRRHVILPLSVFVGSLLTVVVLFRTYQSYTVDPRISERKMLIQKIVDYGHLKDRRYWSRRDSSTHDAIANWILWDSERVPNDDIRSVVSDTKSASWPSLFFLTWRRLAFLSAKNYLPTAFLSGTLLIISVVGLTRQKQRARLAWYMVGVLLCAAAFTVLGMFFKLPLRLLSPMLVSMVFVLIACTERSHVDAIRTGRRMRVLLLALFTIACAAYLVRTSRMADVSKKRLRQNMAKLAEIEERAGTQWVVMTAPASQLLKGLDPMNQIPLKTKKYLFMEGWSTWLPGFERQLQAVTGGTNFGSLIDFLAMTSHTVVSTHENNRAIIMYVRDFYGRCWEWEVVCPECEMVEMSFGQRLNYYQGRPCDLQSQ